MSKRENEKEIKLHNFIMKYTVSLNFDADCMNYW